MVSDLAFLNASFVSFASICANKLRGQYAGAKTVTVFISFNWFWEALQEYVNAVTTAFITPISDTLEITHEALSFLQKKFVLE